MVNTLGVKRRKARKPAILDRIQLVAGSIERVAIYKQEIVSQREEGCGMRGMRDAEYTADYHGILNFYPRRSAKSVVSAANPTWVFRLIAPLLSGLALFLQCDRNGRTGYPPEQKDP